MRHLLSGVEIILTALLLGCGGGGNTSVPPTGGNPGIINPPVVDQNPQPASDSAPAVDLQITSPVDGAVVGGKTPISTNAGVIEGAQNVKILADGVAISYQPFCIWDTTQVSNGPHEIRVEIQWSSAGSRESREIQVIVDNKVPQWTSGKSSSSLPEIRIDSVSPASVMYGYSGEVLIYGSGFSSVNFYPGLDRLLLLPDGFEGGAGLYVAPLVEVVSDTVIRIIHFKEPNPADAPVPVASYVIALACNGIRPSECVVVALSSVQFAVNDDGSAPRLTSIQPDILLAGYWDNVSLDIVGTNLTPVPYEYGGQYGLSLSKRRLQLGDNVFTSNTIYYTHLVDIVGGDCLRAAYRDERSYWVEEGEYVAFLVYGSYYGYGSDAAVLTSSKIYVRNSSDSLLPPSVSAIATPDSGYSPLATTLTASAQSSNPGGYITSYQWDFENDGSWDGSGQSVQRTFTLPAEITSRTYPVKVMVTDSFDQSAAAYAYVSVEQEVVGPPPPPPPPPPEPREPVASFQITGVSPSTWVSPVTVYFQSTSTALDGAYIIGCEWDLDGNGSLDRTDLYPDWTYTAPDGGSKTYYPRLTVWDSNYKTDTYSTGITIQGRPLPSGPPQVSLTPTEVSGSSPLTPTFYASITPQGSAGVASIGWYLGEELVQTGGQQFTRQFVGWVGVPYYYVVWVLVTDTNGLQSSAYALVTVDPIPSSGGGSGGGEQGGNQTDPDLPPIEIQGNNTDDSYYDVNGSIAVGQGAPNESIRQAFLAAFQRANGAAGAPVAQVQRRGSGWMQELRNGAAGAGAIMMMDGQSQAAWVHGDIFHKYMSLGGPNSYLGYPLQDEAVGYVSSVTGAQNAYTLFSGDGVANASIVYHKDGAHRYNVSVVRGAIFNVWKAQDYGRGALGLPISDQYQVGSDWRSDFEGGYLIYRTSQNRVEKVLNGSGGAENNGGSGLDAQPNIQALFEQKRTEYGTAVMGFPIGGIQSSSELSMSGNFYGGMKYYFQLFDSSGSGWYGALVYNPDSMQVYYVHGGIFKAWWWIPDNRGVDYGGMGLELGLPISDEYPGGGFKYSDFEGGYIRWDPATPDAAYHVFDGSLPQDQYGNLDDFISQWIHNELGNIWANLFNDVQEAWNLGDIALQVSSSRLKLLLPKVGLLFDFFDWQTFTIRLSQSPSQNEIDFLNRISRVAAEKGDTVYSELLNARIGLAGRDEWKLVRLANDQYLLTRFVEYVKNNPGRGAEWIQNNVQ